MRPKKRILLIDTNEDRVAIRRFFLETRGFRVLSAISAAEAREMFATEYPDLAICAWPSSLLDVAAVLSYRSALGVPCMVLADKSAGSETLPVDAVLVKPTPAEILERAKLMCARKRGPKPAIKPPVAVPVMSVADRRVA